MSESVVSFTLSKTDCKKLTWVVFLMLLLCFFIFLPRVQVSKLIFLHSLTELFHKDYSSKCKAMFSGQK